MIEMTSEQIETLMSEARIGRLCMADDEGRPYAVPLPFCWHAGALYLRIPLTGRKGRILSVNDRVCFEADRYTETLDDYASVLVEGRLVEVVSLDERQAVKAANDLKYDRLRHGHRPGHGRTTALAQLPLKKIVVESLSGRAKEASTAQVLAAR